jgi:hypothetical protein
VSIEIHNDLNKMTLDELVGNTKLLRMQTPRTRRQQRAGAAISCCSPGPSGKLVRFGMEAAGVMTVASMEGIMMTTTSAARARDTGGAATEAGASIVAHAGTWRGSARRRTRRLCSPALLTVNFRQPRVLVIHWFRL